MQNAGLPVTNADVQLDAVLSAFYGQLTHYSVHLDLLNVNNGLYQSSFVSPVPGFFGILALDRVGSSMDQTSVEFLGGPSTTSSGTRVGTLDFVDDVKNFFKQLDFEFYPPILAMRVNDPATPPATKATLLQRLADLKTMLDLLNLDFRLEGFKAAGRNPAALQAQFNAAETAAKEAVQRLSDGQKTAMQATFGTPVDFDKFQMATELFNNFDLIAGTVGDAIDRIKMAQALGKALKDAIGTPGEAAARKAFEDFIKDGIVERGPDGASAHLRWAKFANIAIDLNVDPDFWGNLKPILAKGSAITVAVLDKDKKKKLTKDEITTIRNVYDPLRPKPGDTPDDKKKKLQTLEQKLQDLVKTIFIDKKTVAQLPGFDSNRTIRTVLTSATCSLGSEGALRPPAPQPLSLVTADDGSIFGFGADRNGVPYFAYGSTSGSLVSFVIGGPGVGFGQGLSQTVYSGVASTDGSVSGTFDGMFTGLAGGTQDNCVASGTFVVQARAVCDLNGDGKTDIDDLATIFAAHNTPAVSGDPRDADGDGTITVNDVRYCTLRCTNPGCAR